MQGLWPLSLGPTGKPSGKLETLSSSEQCMVAQIQEESDNQKNSFRFWNARELLRVQEALMELGRSSFWLCMGTAAILGQQQWKIQWKWLEQYKKEILRSVCRGHSKRANYFWWELHPALPSRQPLCFMLPHQAFGFGGSGNLGHLFSPTTTSVNLWVLYHCLAPVISLNLFLLI